MGGICGGLAREDPHGDGKLSLPWWPTESQKKLAANTGQKGSCTAKLLLNQEAIFCKMLAMLGVEETDWRADITVLPYPPDDKSICIANDDGRMGSRESKILVNQRAMLSMLCGDDIDALPYTPTPEAYKYANIDEAHSMQKGARESMLWVNQVAIFHRLKGYAVEEVPVPVTDGIENGASFRGAQGVTADNTVLTCQLVVNQDAIFRQIYGLPLVKGRAKMRVSEAKLMQSTSPQREVASDKVKCSHCNAEQDSTNVKCCQCQVLLHTHTQANDSEEAKKAFAAKGREVKKLAKEKRASRRNSISALKAAQGLEQERKHVRRSSIS